MSAYDDIAEWYYHWVGTHSMREDPFFPAVEAFIVPQLTAEVSCLPITPCRIPRKSQHIWLRYRRCLSLSILLFLLGKA